MSELTVREVPEDETGTDGTDGPGEAPQVAGESPGYQDGGAAGGGVVVAYCHESRVSHSWHRSIMDLFVFDKVSEDNHIAGAPFAIACDGPHGLVEGRNMAVRNMLDNTDAEWLFWIDTDMGFEPDSLRRLLAAADPIDRPVVGGLCFALKHVKPDGYSGFVQRPLPTLFRMAKDIDGHMGFANRMVYPSNSLVQVAGTGSAFILIHRSVLEDIRSRMGDSWYEPVRYEDGRPLSEDLSFCWRAGVVGAKVFVHTGVKTTHHKEIWLNADQYEMPDEEPLTRRVKQEAPTCGCGLSNTIKAGHPLHKPHCDKARVKQDD